MSTTIGCYRARAGLDRSTGSMLPSFRPGSLVRSMDLAPRVTLTGRMTVDSTIAFVTALSPERRLSWTPISAAISYPRSFYYFPLCFYLICNYLVVKHDWGLVCLIVNFLGLNLKH